MVDLGDHEKRTSLKKWRREVYNKEDETTETSGMQAARDDSNYAIHSHIDGRRR